MLPLAPTMAFARFVPGNIYRLIEHEDRSQRSHAHYFASVHDAWQNLPERYADRFPTAEHLRKWALIQSGFHDQRSIVAASKAEALRIAAFFKPLDEHAVIVAREATVVVCTAKSQSSRAMGRDEFQKSKTAVLDMLSEMIGVAPGALERQAASTA